ncbi:class I SAM-dependent methyltransferase [bacterium]|jgi:ubiquinone/menaquinone biosynthesis C-methylase UbiE|nr:class I SAM-dependent methyltransferase [bacterium]
MNRFDNVAKDWESKPSRVQTAKSSVDNIKDIIDLKPNFKILDYGCGTGLIGFGLSTETNTVIGMDYSAGMVEKFNKKANELGFSNIRAVQHNINEQELPQNEFDLIAISMTLHHIKDTNMFIKKAKDALKTGGYLCINDLVTEDGTFHDEHKNEGVEHFGYDKDELCKLIENNDFELIEYKIVYTDYRNNKEYPIFQIIAKLK